MVKGMEHWRGSHRQDADTLAVDEKDRMPQNTPSTNIFEHNLIFLPSSKDSSGPTDPQGHY